MSYSHLMDEEIVRLVRTEVSHTELEGELTDRLATCLSVIEEMERAIDTLEEKLADCGRPLENAG